MKKTSSAHGASGPGQSKPFTSNLHIQQPFVIAVFFACAGFALLSNTRASAPVVETSAARASLEVITAQQPPLAFTVPQELKAEGVTSVQQTAAAGPKDLVPVTRFVAPAPATTPQSEKQALALPQELGLVHVPEPRADAHPLPPKVKGAYPRGLHPVIKHSMVEASRYLPEGWQLEFMNALRDAPGVWNGPHGKRDKTGGALAVDVWLVNPKGERLCNFKCAPHFEAYQTFMQMVKHIQDRDFPAYKNQGRWGGYFGGSYANDEMHYDLEPSAWTAAGNWEKGLFPQYAYFGKKSDIGKGMGQIAAYKLPATGTTLASLQTPAPAVQAVAVAANTRPAPAAVAVPVKVAAAKPVLPVAQVIAPARRAIPMQQVAAQWKMRPTRAQFRERYDADQDTDARAEYRERQQEARERVRVAQIERASRRSAGRTMREYSDD